MTSFYMRQRLKRGLFWRGRIPGWEEAKRFFSGILAGFVVLLVMGLANEIDTMTDRAIAAERAAEIYGAHAKVMRDCESGATGYHYPDGRIFECQKPL